MFDMNDSNRTLPEALPVGPLRCPLCEERLSLDPWWLSPHWLCPSGHSYSNVRVLIAELRERGWLPIPAPVQSDDAVA